MTVRSWYEPGCQISGRESELSDLERIPSDAFGDTPCWIRSIGNSILNHDIRDRVCGAEVKRCDLEIALRGQLLEPLRGYVSPRH